MTERRAFSSCVYLLNTHNELLLVSHPRYGMWLPVGGELEPNETPFEAALREVKEETGLALDPLQFPLIDPMAPRGFFCYDEHAAGSKGLHLNFNFVALVEDPVITLSNEHTEFRWWAREHGTDVSVGAANVRHCLRQLNAFRFYSSVNHRGVLCALSTRRFT